MSKHWKIIECLFALHTYRLMDIKKNELIDDYVKTQLYKENVELMNNVVNNNRNEGAMENKLQNVSFVDPRANQYHPISPLPHIQNILRELYDFYEDGEGRLTKKVLIDVNCLLNNKPLRYLNLDKYE